MIPDKYKKIIQALKIKTELNQTIWNKSSGSDSFSLKYSEGMIEIDLWFDTDAQTSYADITLFNKSGDRIDYIQVSSEGMPTDFKLLQELHMEIRRKYYRVDDHLDSFLRELSNKNNVIGDVSDDLPF